MDTPNPLTDPEEGPRAGNPDGDCAIPEQAGLADSSAPSTVVGTGTPASCTADAFIEAVAEGGQFEGNPVYVVNSTFGGEEGFATPAATVVRSAASESAGPS